MLLEMLLKDLQIADNRCLLTVQNYSKYIKEKKRKRKEMEK